jgi:hypothetical protein
MMEAVHTSETSAHLTSLHGAISQKVCHLYTCCLENVKSH